jgi:DNA invertase Pin-like site-specific DNA recombinase
MKTIRMTGYIRVSTQEQARDGVSLDAQRNKLVSYADAMDIELVDICEDRGLTAKNLDRPGLRQALTMLRLDMAEGLLVAKLDRLTRSVRDLGTLVETYFTKTHTLCSVADHVDTRTPGGKLVLNVLMSVAQWEVEANAERTRDALAQVKAEGGTVGGVRFGQRRKGSLDANGKRTGEVDANGRIVVEECPEERETVDMVERFSKRDGLGARAIAARLTELGVKTKRGGRWHATQVQRMISRQKVAQ